MSLFTSNLWTLSPQALPLVSASDPSSYFTDELEDARQGLTHPSNSKYSSWPHPPSFLSLFSQHCSNLIPLPSLFWSHPFPLPQGLNRITCFLLYVFNLFLPSLIFPPKALKHIWFSPIKEEKLLGLSFLLTSSYLLFLFKAKLSV